VAERLAEQRLATYELLIEAHLGLGEFDDVIPMLVGLVAEHPARESLQRLNMLALHGAGRSSDALRAFERTRTALAEELGADPSPELGALHRRILLGEGGPRVQTEVPPAATRRPAQLPADLHTFNGRSVELDWLVSPAGAAVKAVDGMPGVGKTALAVHAAHQLAAQFPDGQLFVDLQGFSPDHALDPGIVLEGMLSALGVPGAGIPAATAQRATLYRSCLADKRVLVVLDNAADESQVRPLLPGTGPSRVLITSRRRLVGLDSVDLISLDVLTRAESVGLITRIVGADRMSPAADTIARLCGDLPLAVTVAVSRLRARMSWTLEYVAERLHDERRRFVELSAGERSVSAAFRLSYENLSSVERRVFRRAGLHPGGTFDARAAAALAEVSPDDADEALERLVDVNLVRQPGPGRYRLHDLLRGYAQEMVQADEQEANRNLALARLFSYYQWAISMAMDVIAPSTPRNALVVPEKRQYLADYEQAMTWLDAERRAILAVAAAMFREGFHADLANLCASVWRYFDARGHYDDAEAIHSLALSAARAVGNVVMEYHALQNYGSALWRLERFAEAIDCFSQVIVMTESAGDVRMQARARGNLALTYWRLGELDIALDHLDWVRVAAPKVGDKVLESRALHKIGVIRHQKGQHQEALKYLDEAMALALATETHDLQAECLNALGVVARSLADADLAFSRFHAALKLASATGNRNQQAIAHQGMAGMYQDVGEFAQAGHHRRVALELYAQIGMANSREARQLTGSAGS
jgi:tetratricopeptide (TPR) repeat protein